MLDFLLERWYIVAIAMLVVLYILAEILLRV